ncbi:hypothetical protein [Asanoa hainanensis]|uniref:hypothetical protein n=1 Tax=Asanoa hainanensis TaxID=560556 RepID=UPI000B79111C|nr:hypothetical protein [Asanoa hainanensis]
MSALVLAIPAVAERTGREVTVVGGLAVVCRLSRPYRATTDLDTVHRRHDGEPTQLELLLSSGASRSGPSGVLVPTAIGQVQVDLLEVTDADLAQLPEDPTDRLHVLSHAWAAASATLVTIRATGLPDLAVRVAEPGPLVAMKLQSVMNRGRAKEATDLLDIIRLCVDPVAGPTALTQLASSEPQIREDACRHASRWFDHQATRSLRVIRAVPDGQEIEIADLQLVSELLHSVLPVGGAEGI